MRPPKLKSAAKFPAEAKSPSVKKEQAEHVPVQPDLLCGEAAELPLAQPDLKTLA
jgi:hypothetical protein